MHEYFIRIGSLGEVRTATALAPLQRGRRVVVRSPRGLETGEILSQRSPKTDAAPVRSEFRIIRPTSSSDELLIERLLRYKSEAIEVCRRRLVESGSSATLLDVDQLLDGGTLLMHFIGQVDAVAQSIADEVARHYEELVQTHHLSELLNDGCGPDCGTAAGCGSSCGSCAACGH